MKVLGTAVLLAALTIASTAPGGNALAEEIAIVGTGSGAIIIEKLAKAFTRENPQVSMTVPPSIGSGGGIKAVGTDQAMVGRTARGIKENEKEYGLVYTPVLKLPIVFFSHKGVGLKSLTVQQVCDIYSGKTTNWKEVGGPDADIRVIRREDGDSSLDVLLKSFPGFREIAITPKSKTTLTDPETCEVAQTKEYTIAFGPFANTRETDVTVLSVDGKDPTDASYPYQATLALIYKEKNKAGSLGKFIEFVTSPAARDIIREAGGTGM